MSFRSGWRSFVGPSLVTGLLLSLAAPALGGYPAAPDLHPNLTRSVERAHRGEAVAPERGGTGGPVTNGMELVGFHSLGRPDNGTFSSDVWSHGDYAYVGTFFDFTAQAVGVQVIDISDPANPVLVSQLPAPEAYTGTNDVKVASIDTRKFRGDLAVVSNEGGRAGEGGANGIQLWDVSDPHAPEELARVSVGPVHNTYLYQRGRRAFVALVVSFAEVFSQFFPPFITVGDFLLVEVTDPRNPTIVSDWGAGKDGGFSFGFPFEIPEAGIPATCEWGVCRGDDPFVFLHDVWVDDTGTIAYLAYWDLGLILLDISDPAVPRMIGRGIEPETLGSNEGNCHAAVPMPSGNTVIVTDEDFTPGPWGFLRTFDTRRRSKPIQVGAYATDGALNDLDESIDRTIHNIATRGDEAYISWYYEGVYVFDVSRAEAPAPVASFVSPAGTGPGNFWGIKLHGDLILASDIESGLYILRRTDDDDDDSDTDTDDDDDTDTDTDDDDDDSDDDGDDDKARSTGVASHLTRLGDAYPNPVSSSVTIPFELGRPEQVSVDIHDVTGRLVREIDLGVLAPGTHEGAAAARWNGKSAEGRRVPSGIYFYSLRAGDFHETKKLVLLD